MTDIAVIDHGAGNLVSIAQGLRRAGAAVIIARSPSDLDDADGIVLPGVGSTAAVMNGLDIGGFTAPLRRIAAPLLGICVGMQVLFESSAEDDTACLGLMSGRVERIADAPRLPHIGWNDLEVRKTDPLLVDLPSDPTVYFVHSYAPVPTDRNVIIATTEYGSEIVAAVRRGHIAGVQFHPERSGGTGLGILARFVQACREGSRAA